MFAASAACPGCGEHGSLSVSGTDGGVRTPLRGDQRALAAVGPATERRADALAGSMVGGAGAVPCELVEVDLAELPPRLVVGQPPRVALETLRDDRDVFGVHGLPERRRGSASGEGCVGSLDRVIPPEPARAHAPSVSTTDGSIRLRYAATCATCGRLLAPRDEAHWASKRTTCAGWFAPAAAEPAPVISADNWPLLAMHPLRFDDVHVLWDKALGKLIRGDGPLHRDDITAVERELALKLVNATGESRADDPKCHLPG